MLSRAHLLIEKEYTKFNKDPPWGIDAIPLTDTNIFEWGAKIQGPRDTIWDGGVFRLYVRFDENFNQRPPQICFHTIPFHPNVDMITGAPCLEIIDNWDKWRESFSIGMVLLSIQMMLANPILDGAVNTAAAELIERSPRAYRQMVLDCVTASQRVEAGLSAQLSESVSCEKIQCVPAPDKPPPKAATPLPIRVSQLSFEDYHETWRGIATSKTQPGSKHTIMETMKDTTVLRNNHIRMTDQEIEEQLSRQLEEHNGLIYGRFRAKKTAQEDRAAKLEKIDKMKKIYLPPRKPNCTPVQEVSGSQIGGGREEPIEGEVDDLIAWSAKLNTDLIDTV